MQALIALAAVLLPLFAQAKDNPEFTYWADHKVGSWVKYKMEMDAQGVKVLVESHQILLEVGKEKVVVEQKTKLTAAGQEQPESSTKEEIFKDKDKDPIKIEKEGDETIEVAGKRLSCHWIEGTQKETRKVKYWLCKDVPGGMVKGEAAGGDIPGTMTITAGSWEKK